MRKSLLMLSVVSVAVWLACGREAKPPNIVVIVIDTLRADHLGCYGYHRPTSPRIDALAESGALFENASSVSSHTRPATASLMTGLYPAVHGAVGFKGSVSPDVRTLSELLSEAGYRTVGFHRNGNVSERFGFGRGFDRYVGVEKGVWHELRRTTSKDIPLHISQVDDSLVTRQALDFFQEESDSPFFLYLHFADPHDPYTPPRDSPLFPAEPLTPIAELFYEQTVKSAAGKSPVLTRLKLGKLQADDFTRRQIVELYDAEIAATDVQVGRVLDGLAEAGLSERTLVFLTADHGEEFWDHGELGHGQSHHPELLQVPFMIAGPGIQSRRLSTPVSLIDLMPTVLDATGLEVEGLQGRSLLPVAKSRRRQPEVIPVYSESLMRMDFYGDPLLFRSLRVGDLKLTLDFRRKRKLLFDLAADPGEQENLGATEATSRRQLLETLLETHAENLDTGLQYSPLATEIPKNLEERLRALGYVGSEGESVAPSFIRRPMRLLDVDTYGFLGYETEGATYQSFLDFSVASPPEEQLLYGFGVPAAGIRQVARKAGLRLQREPEHQKWRVAGNVPLPPDGSELRLDVRVDGGEAETHHLQSGRPFEIEGLLPPEAGRFVRLDFECEQDRFVALGWRSDDGAPCLLVTSLGLGE